MNWVLRLRRSRLTAAGDRRMVSLGEVELLVDLRIGPSVARKHWRDFGSTAVCLISQPMRPKGDCPKPAQIMPQTCVCDWVGF